MTTIGVLVPYRSDPEMIAFVEEHLDLEADLVVCGSQDGMSDDELRALSEGVEPNSYAEILEDGSTVNITREVVLEGLQRQAQRLLHDGCDAVMICCTLPWDELDAMAGVVTPYTILEDTAATVAGGSGAIGVMQPVEAAMEEEIQHWLALGERHGLEIHARYAAPQVPGEDVVFSDDQYAEVARSLAVQDVDVIVMDCMAYTEHHRAVVAEASGKPVLRAMQLTGMVVEHAYR
ncbi:MAG: AroM family protein [Acidimicrobiaceae bacterium]|nr:AroM family protein [Acidimicrobiaceae bacterium]